MIIAADLATHHERCHTITRVTVRGVFIGTQERRQLAAGDVVFEAGAAGDQMFGVVSGEVVLSRDGVEVARVGEGGTFGEMAIIDASPRSATATAAVDTELAVIDKRTFLFLVHETPTFALEVMASLAQRLRG